MVYESGNRAVTVMNPLNICFTMFIWMISAQTQSLPQPQYSSGINGPVIYPGQIYFEQNSPQLQRNTPSYFNNVIHKNIVANQNQETTHSQGIQFSTDDNVNRFQDNNFALRPPKPNRNRDAVVNVTGRPVVKVPNNQQGVPKPIDMKSLVITNFALNLLKNVDQAANNVVISPYSIATILALLQQGALGTTQDQITTALQMTPDTSANAFKAFTDAIQKRNSRNVLKVANNVYTAEDFRLNPTFKNVATQVFNSEVTPIRFTRSELAVEEINSWVAARTNNKIQDLLKPEAIDESSQMVLVNAVYFKGLWQSRFKPESTLEREFNLLDGSVKKVKFMRIRRIFKTGFDRSNNAQIITLPFENEQYSLMIVLPSEKSSLNTLIASLTDSQLAGYNNFTSKEVDLAIPKFSIKSDTLLNEVLKKIGVTSIFSGRSNLSNIVTYGTLSPQVTAALHTAMLSIDEDGGTASAATAFAVVALSYDDPSVVLKVDRPFLAVLWDNESTLPLFMAKIDDPTA